MNVDKKLLPAIQKAVVATFDKGNWIEFGYETNFEDLINNHPRLLRSLDWNDPDYGACVFKILECILQNNDDALNIILSKEPIKNWLQKKEPSAYIQLYDDDKHVPQFAPNKTSPKESVLEALQDADDLVKSGKYPNAIDRMHTAFHGYLKSICDKHSITYQSDAKITALYKLIHQNIIKINATIQHPKEITSILASFSNVLDKVNEFRNNKSLAHPKVLLGIEDALLMVNLIRAMFHYLEAKLP